MVHQALSSPTFGVHITRRTLSSGLRTTTLTQTGPLGLAQPLTPPNVHTPMTSPSISTFKTQNPLFPQGLF